jgi:hypothetical protein
MKVRLRKIYRNSKTVSGFFEDVPTLAIVIVGIALFLSAVVASYSAYLEHQHKIEFFNKAYKFANAVRAYDGLTYDGKEGVFECNKIIFLTSDNISRDLQPGYPFQIVIEDKSDYHIKYETNISTAKKYPAELMREGMQVIVLSINIWVSEEEVHPGRLIVTLWR